MTFDYAALEAAGIEQVTIVYNGSGDEGWIEEIVVDVGGEMDRDLEQAVEMAARDVLESNFPGWEINEGSSGTMTLHVQAHKTDLHHGSRYEQVRYEDREIS